jgi:hypothetical protein
MDPFRNTLIGCNPGDLGYKGLKYTWSNKKETWVLVKKRLDRAVATPNWCGLFPDAVIEVLPVSCLDHNPLWMTLTSDLFSVPRLFRYEACWDVSPECAEVVEQAWKQGEFGQNSMKVANENLLRCRFALLNWSKQTCGAVKRSLNSLTRRLGILQSQEYPGKLRQIASLQAEINSLLEMEDLRWRQRAKRNWFQKGDKNT